MPFCVMRGCTNYGSKKYKIHGITYHRCWTFTMSCVISLAVCCTLLTGCMSGIALGYNYSLAEYIDLKETNVSIYLKRGIFDDEINDDMEFRRSNRLPIQGHIKDENLMTGASDESTTLRSGRRLEDSLYQSGDKNNFEDALMRLTAKPPDYSSTDGPKQWSMIEPNSLEEIKAVKSAINMRRMEAAATRTSTTGPKTTPYQDISIVPNFPYGSYPGGINSMRRMPWYSPLSIDLTTMGRSSLRDAVPARNINDPMVWMYPKVPEHALPSIMHALSESPTYPTPITPRPGPVRPTRPTYIKPKTKSTKPPTEGPEEVPKSVDEEMDTLKEKFMMQKSDFSRLDEKKDKENDDDYEDDIKGAPLRKKRYIFKLHDHNQYKLNDQYVEDKNIKLIKEVVTKTVSKINKTIFTSAEKDKNHKSTIQFYDHRKG